MPSEKLEFPGSQGHTLAARLDTPSGPIRAYALFAHCFTCGKDILAASRIAQALNGHGIAVLRFDFTGLGASDGEFANTNFSSNIGDLAKAAEFLRDTREAPKILIGHSLGGAAILAVAGQVPEATSVVTIAAPSDPGHVSHLFADARAEIEAQGEAEVMLAGRRFCVQRQFLEDIADNALAQRVAKLKKALIVFHAPGDDTVSIDNASEIFLAAKHPKSFVSLDDADHLLSRPTDAAYVADIISAWADRYIADPAAPKTVYPKAVEGTVVVEETGFGKFQQAMAAGPHNLLADEPPSVGGDDTGPTPYDLLTAGLGACTSMTIRMYARHKNLPLDGVHVELAHDKIHAEDCEHCETEDGKIDRIRRKITLRGDLDDAQRAKLLEIADKCPVHRTLHSEVTIETSLTS
ncbi:MAG: alpha/beta fold hydrolase [Pseudomonadota bacterium]